MGIKSLIIFFVVVSLQITNTSTKQCHYSCSSCTQPYHQYCKSCIEGYDLWIVKDPTQIPIQYKDTVTPTGICTNQEQLGYPNILGIIILVCTFIFLPITRSKLLFYIATTIQSFSLIKLLQVHWLRPTSYFLNSFQYLSPCNLITKDIKANTWQINLYSFYQVNELYVQPDLTKSFAFLGILNIVVFALIITLHIIRFIKSRFLGEQCRALICFNQWALPYQIGFLNILYYFLIQQTILSFVIAFQFTPSSSFNVGTIIAYSISIAIFCIQIFRFKITLFYNRLVQYYSIVKKLIYPIFIAVPFQYQYFLIVFMGINCTLQAFFDYKIKSYPFKSRNTLYKALQFITILFFGIFFAVDSSSAFQGPPKTMSIILTIALSLNVIFFFVQIIFGIKELIQKQTEQKAKQQNKNKNLVPQASVLDRDHNNTLGMVTTKRQQHRQSTQQAFKQQRNINQSIQQPPRIERSDTKDSSFKKSKDDQKNLMGQPIEQQPSQLNKQKIKSNQQIQGQSIDLEQIQQVKYNSGTKDDKLSPEKQKIQSIRNKNNKQLASQLKKRYGV